MLPPYTQILHCHKAEAMPQWQHTLSQSQMDTHTFSFHRCNHIHSQHTFTGIQYKYGGNIPSVVCSHHTHTQRVVGSVVYGADVPEVWVRCITRRVITAFHSSWSLWFTSHPALLLYIDLRGTDEWLHLSLSRLSPAEHGSSFYPHRKSLFVLCASPCLYTLSIFWPLVNHECIPFKGQVEIQ